MSDETKPMTDENHDPDRTASNHLRSDGGTNTDSMFESRDLRTVLNYAALAGLVLFALVSAVQLYSAVGGVISQLIAVEYRDFFRAAFNLVVLLLCVGG
ncbi:MAG: hypothetical protein ACOCP2_00555, partial [Halohasta sp.]